MNVKQKPKTNTMKQKFLKQLKAADPSIQAWTETLLDTLPSCEAKGYLSGKLEIWNQTGMPVSGSLKLWIKDWCEHTKWD